MFPPQTVFRNLPLTTSCFLEMKMFLFLSTNEYARNKEPPDSEAQTRHSSGGLGEGGLGLTDTFDKYLGGKYLFDKYLSVPRVDCTRLMP